RVIQTAPADRSYNCHGWVFAGERFFIPPPEVDWILQENGYHTVNNPSVGDLIIYRDEKGIAIHSGLVWAMGGSGRIMVESKAGWLARSLHTPENTPYGKRWTYFHSSRPGHALHGVRSAPATASQHSLLSQTNAD